MSWWVRPLIRLVAAVLLPFVVPGLVTMALWALPGDPVSILCAPGSGCNGEYLAQQWHLDQGPFAFYLNWMSNAASLEFGNSWSVLQGAPIYDIVMEAIPYTLALVGTAVFLLGLGTIEAAFGWLPKRVTAVLWQPIGLMPSVILALLAAAFVQITYGAAGGASADTWKILLGGLVLALADGAMASAVSGTRGTLEEETKRRYVQIAILRGESVLANTLPNVLPALVGQFRGRILQVLSGAVIVEVIVKIPGLGELLWAGTLKQDFGFVLASAFVVSVVSGGLLFLQAVIEIATALYVRRSPSGVVA